MGTLHHLCDVDDLTDQELENILQHAERMRRGEPPPTHAGALMGLIFEEPSVRTKFGFTAAMARMHGAVAEIPPAYKERQMSSRETMADILRATGSYADVIVARCESLESLAEITRHSPVAVINAGTGASAHPTQALIDVFAMRAHYGRVDGLRIGLMGDLATSRAAKSLLRLLARYRPGEVRLMHPGPSETLGSLQGSARAWRDLGAQRDLTGLDVIYMAGFPAGTLPPGQDPEREKLRRDLGIDSTAVAGLKDGALILCPMPRIDEIAHELDDHLAMGMFKQSQDAIHIRCATIDYAILRQKCLGESLR